MHYTRNGTSLRRDKSERAPIQSPDFDVAAPPAFPSFSSQVGLAFLVATERIKRWSVFLLFGKDPDKSCSDTLQTFFFILVAVYLLYKACSTPI